VEEHLVPPCPEAPYLYRLHDWPVASEGRVVSIDAMT
jgi:hypothetical protein